MIKALIFDVDGTLAETEELHRRAFNDTFADYGLDWHWNRTDYAGLLKTTGGKERIRQFVETEQPQRAGDFIDPDAIAAMHARKTARYGELMRDGEIELRPGMEEVIAQARSAGLGLAIATTTSRQNVVNLFAATIGADMLASFKAVCCGEDVSAKKPASDVYDLAVSQLGLKPAQCLAFEDTANGVKSARTAGIDVIVTVSQYSAGEDFTGALAIYEDLTDDRFRLDQFL